MTGLVDGQTTRSLGNPIQIVRRNYIDGHHSVQVDRMDMSYNLPVNCASGMIHVFIYTYIYNQMMVDEISRDRAANNARAKLANVFVNRELSSEYTA